MAVANEEVSNLGGLGLSALVWWLIPIGAVSLTLLWFAWKYRPRKTPQPDEGIKRRELMREAMKRSMPSQPDS